MTIKYDDAIFVRLKKEKKSRLEKIAKKKKLTASDLVRQILDNYLDINEY